MNDNSTDKSYGTFFEHLEELRYRLIVSFIAIIVMTIAWWYFADYFFKIIMIPGNEIIENIVYTHVTEPFVIKIKLAFIAGLVTASPIVLTQIWLFVAPGLKKSEKKYLIPSFTFGLLLFLAGVVFAFEVVLPTALLFFISLTPPGVQQMITIGKYIGFVVMVLLSFGIAFELPIVMVFLGKIGLINARFLRKNRRYAFLVITIASAVITPTVDAFTMFLMIIPLYILFEISILLVHLFGKSALEDDEEEDDYEEELDEDLEVDA
jgi:sec-independent protein translocase protein TatC